MTALASLQDVELRVIHWIACDLRGPATDAVVGVVNHVVPGLVLVGALLVLGLLVRSVRPRVLLAALTGLFTLGAVHAAREAMWTWAPRTRPGRLFRLEDSLRGAAIETCADHPDAWIVRGQASPSGPSLPSSHVVTAASLAVACTVASRWAALVGWLYALLVGFARVYLGKHWPTDVLASLALAGALGWACFRGARALEPWLTRRCPWLPGRARAAPPPSGS